MQGEIQSNTEFSGVSDNPGNMTSQLTSQCHSFGSNVAVSMARKKRKCAKAPRKPHWFTRRRSNRELPTRFLIGGTISDPLNLQGLEKDGENTQSVVNTREIGNSAMVPKCSRRISLPKVYDTTDPLNLKDFSCGEAEASFDHCRASMEKTKNAASQIHYQSVPPLLSDADESEGIAKKSLSVDFCEDTEEKLCSDYVKCNNDDRGLVCFRVPDNVVNVPKTDGIDPAWKVTDSMSAEHMPSLPNEDKTSVSTQCNKIISHKKFVSPAVPQFLHRRARKRKRQSSPVSDEQTVSLTSSSHKSSCNKKKFPCGNYIAYYGYRNKDRVKDPRLDLLPKELFDGKEVLDIGCNAGMVTIAVASTYMPKRILGTDVDKRLIGLAKQNVRRYLDENSYSMCLKAAFVPIAAGTLPSSECSFPHNIMFQLVKF